MFNQPHANPLHGPSAVGARLRRSMAPMSGCTADWSANAAAADLGCGIAFAKVNAKVHGQRPRGGPS
jgi:hypothetical protein